MKFRCLAMIGLGAVMALAVPMHAFAERTVDRTQKTSSVNVEKPKAKTKSVARNKKKPDAKAEPAKAESDNFFEALVGRQGCCESSAARRYGPAKICR